MVCFKATEPAEEELRLPCYNELAHARSPCSPPTSPGSRERCAHTALASDWPLLSPQFETLFIQASLCGLLIPQLWRLGPMPLPPLSSETSLNRDTLQSIGSLQHSSQLVYICVITPAL